MPDADVIRESIITCSACGTAKTETMPTDACVYFYECTGCGALLRPKRGDCCVFCSYGSVPCPPIQDSNGGPRCCQSEEGSMTTEIRPGVQRPDWSVVTKPAARAALLARDHARGSLSEKWKLALSASQDLTWRKVLALFGKLGRPPGLTEIAGETGLPPDQVHTLLAELQAHDLLGMDRVTGEIIYAYPFTRQAVEHRVILHNRALYALCAIDVLGVGGMFRTDVTFASSCRFCQTPIEIATGRAGQVIGNARPGDTVVWYDLAYDQTAATSCCPSIGFFCSDDHLQQWLASKSPPRIGFRLTLAEAMEVGRAIFEPVLAAQ
jgi:hypothetical protein